MLEVYQKRTFIEIDTNIWKFLAIFLNVVFKENAYYRENEKTVLLHITLNRCWKLKDFRDQVLDKSASHNLYNKRWLKYTHLAIITTKRIKAKKNRTYWNKGKYVLYFMYQSQSNKERFSRHCTAKREHAFPVKIMAATLFSRFPCSIFRSFFLIHKTVVSTHKTVDNKTPD